MALSEFDLIRRYFTRSGPARPDVVLGVGDDCALLQPPSGKELAVTTDTLVEGVHFSPGTDPEALGHKALAVSLSDLAAMGAKPLWALLAITLPTADPEWLAPFSRGFLDLAHGHGVRLVGGDTTHGPLSITVTLHGTVTPGRALRRTGARPGDRIYLTGTLGDAGVGLLIRQGLYQAPSGGEALLQRLDRPQPRLAAGRALAGIASAAIDLSDGLLADLGHICENSGVGAELQTARLPLSPSVREYLERGGDWGAVVAGGDDYELCFTVPPDRESLLATTGRGCDCDLTRIGVITAESGVHCRLPDGREPELRRPGYDHFT